MKIPLRTVELRPKGHVVGCGVQGTTCLALDLSQGKGGKWSINWSLAGELGDEAFADRLSKMTGRRHFWVSPTEEGGLQVETARALWTSGDGDGALGARLQRLVSRDERELRHRNQNLADRLALFTLAQLHEREVDEEQVQSSEQES